MKDRFRFRAWNKEEKRMYYDAQDTYDYMTGNPVIFAESFGCLLSNDEEWEVEQCTGLKDKNGNLIYEGDCVGFYVYEQDEKWYGGEGTVVWYNSSWGIETSSRFICFENNISMANPQGIEIIGNVHEKEEQKDKE